MNPEALAWIEKQKPDLVGWAEAYVRDSKLYKPTTKTENNKEGQKTPLVKTNQLRNLLNAAQSGSPLAVLKNFLRYQIGRGNQGWRHTESGKQLHKLLENKLGNLCQKGVDDLSKGTERSADPIDQYELEAHLAAQLLGFILREYTYQCRLAGTRP